MNWNTAAADVTERIFNGDQPSGTLEGLRLLLDHFVDANTSERLEGSQSEEFVALGKIALQLGRRHGYFAGPSAAQHVLDIVIRKQCDYGHNNISRFGRFGLLVRMHDKVARLENLMMSGHTPNHESIEDNILDVMGYSIVGTMWEEGSFLLDAFPLHALQVTVVERNRTQDGNGPQGAQGAPDFTYTQIPRTTQGLTGPTGVEGEFHWEKEWVF